MGKFTTFFCLSLTAFFSLGTLSSCSSVGLGYLIQAGRGQLAISNRARPIEDVLKDERVSPRVRKVLAEIPNIKKFGEAQGLKPTRNYIDYVQLDRPAATWVVSACEPLRFQPREWRFPIVGSFTYLGWFDLEDAKKYAGQVSVEEKLDVDVRGATAYSTLGWFRDPVLSSMIPTGEEALGEVVNVVIHESVHATFYINGQSYFNESLASFVADRLTPVYLENHHGLSSPELKVYLDSERQGEKRRLAFHRAYSELEKLYASSKSDADKLSEKAQILTRLKAEVGTQREINNATLIQFKTYGIGEEEFSRMLDQCGKSWDRFWKRIMQLTEKSFRESHQQNLGEALDGC